MSSDITRDKNMIVQRYKKKGLSKRGRAYFAQQMCKISTSPFAHSLIKKQLLKTVALENKRGCFTYI